MAAAPDDDTPPPPTLDSMFMAFAKFNGPAAFDGSTILLSQCDMWMKQSKIFSKTFTTTDTGMLYSKYKKRSIDYATFVDFLAKLCVAKGLDYNVTTEKMINCGPPGSQKID